MRRTFETPDGVLLTLSVPAGEVVVETADVAETTVELEPKRNDSESRDAVQEARVELRPRGGAGHELLVDVDTRRGFRFRVGRGPEVALRIVAPHLAELQARTASADVRAAGRFRAADVKTASGDVSVERVEGDLTVKAASGDVYASEVGGRTSVSAASGDVRVDRMLGGGSVRSASGDLEVRELGASLEASSASGDQRIDTVAQGSLALKSVSGDVSVGVQRGSRLWVDAKSMSGSTSSELELSDAPPDGEGPVVELRATTVSGDIRVTRAG